MCIGIIKFARLNNLSIMELKLYKYYMNELLCLTFCYIHSPKKKFYTKWSLIYFRGQCQSKYKAVLIFLLLELKDLF